MCYRMIAGSCNSYNCSIDTPTKSITNVSTSTIFIWALLLTCYRFYRTLPPKATLRVYRIKICYITLSYLCNILFSIYFLFIVYVGSPFQHENASTYGGHRPSHPCRQFQETASPLIMWVSSRLVSRRFIVYSSHYSASMRGLVEQPTKTDFT